MSIMVYYEVLQVRYSEVGPSAAQLLFMYPFIMDIQACIITKLSCCPCFTVGKPFPVAHNFLFFNNS